MRLAIAALVLAAGCIRSAAYECQSSAECTKDGTQGTCEAVKYCAFPDASCTSGSRYGNLSGPYANQCVGDEPMADAGVDAPRCPASYQPLSGAAHVYHVITATGQWTHQRDACLAESPNAHLAIPQNASELTAFATAAPNNAWIGIDDILLEGHYLTVLGLDPPYLPWAPGEPDNTPNQDCVAMLSGTQKIATETCGSSYAAVCECTP